MTHHGVIACPFNTLRPGQNRQHFATNFSDAFPSDERIFFFVFCLYHILLLMINWQSVSSGPSNCLVPSGNKPSPGVDPVLWHHIVSQDHNELMQPDRIILWFQLSALSSVSGLRWGNYVGSPDQPDPRLAWSQSHHATVASLVALPTGQVFGLGPNSHLLVMYSKERGWCDL